MANLGNFIAKLYQIHSQVGSQLVALHASDCVVGPIEYLHRENLLKYLFQQEGRRRVDQEQNGLQNMIVVVLDAQ